jgi:hypothetical protein
VVEGHEEADTASQPRVRRGSSQMVEPAAASSDIGRMVFRSRRRCAVMSVQAKDGAARVKPELQISGGTVALRR